MPSPWHQTLYDLMDESEIEQLEMTSPDSDQSEQLSTTVERRRKLEENIRREVEERKRKREVMLKREHEYEKVCTGSIRIQLILAALIDSEQTLLSIEAQLCTRIESAKCFDHEGLHQLQCTKCC